MSTPAVTPERRCKRVCACGCGASMEGRRADATWASKACALRWSRANPGKPAPGRGSAHTIDTRSRSGRQISYQKAERAALAALRHMLEHTTQDPQAVARRFMRDALPAKQRAALRERSAA